jgi:F0F1-type ATP synthase assembly protein I
VKRKRYDLSLAMLGFEWAAGVFGLTFVGLWVDRHYETGPWGVLVGLGLGFVGGTYNFVKAVQKAARDAAARAAEGGGEES